MNHPNHGRAEVLRTRDFVGWTVSDSRGEKLGTVDDLLIDRQGKVRFLSVNQGLFKKRVLLPVEMMSWGDGALVLSDWTSDQLRGLPPYDHDVPLTAEVLEEMGRAFPRFYAPHGVSAPTTRLDAQIVPLREAKGFKLSGSSPDLTGWNVFGADGERVGKVAGMLVDPVAMTVRYLAIDLADDLFHLTDDRLVVIPTERVDLRERGNDVWVQGLSAHDVSRLPAYTGGPLDPLIADRVESAFSNAPHTSALPAEGTAPGAASTPLFGGGDRPAGALGSGEVRQDMAAAPPPVAARPTYADGPPPDGRGYADAPPPVDVRREEEFRPVDDGLTGRPVSDAPVAPPLPADALPPPLPGDQGFRGPPPGRPL